MGRNLNTKRAKSNKKDKDIDSEFQANAKSITNSRKSTKNNNNDIHNKINR